jgi:uncharacterized protein DUF3786/putative Fe-S cluster protein
MPRNITPIEIYKVLPRTNCGQCASSTCLAFAAAVIKQEKHLNACPHLDKEIIARYENTIVRPADMDTIREQQLKEFRNKIAAIDLPSRAERLGARKRGDHVVVSCLGREFEINRLGAVMSQCHTHAWFSLPLLDYLLHGKGTDISGRWVPFRELEKGRTWALLFEQRCEKPLKRIADAYSELFEDLVNLFSGASSHRNFDSDISVVLYPFPKVPVLICYWKQEAGLESKLHVFFDDTAEQNLPIDSLFTLGTGLVRMFERIMHKHTAGKSELS